MADVDAALDAPRFGPPRLGTPGIAIALAGLLLLVTIATRWSGFGAAQLHIDDQFYMMTGAAWVRGDLHYVDIWDRKPIGLFLIYAGIAAFGDHGVLPYQLVASLFAFLTSLVIVSIAHRLTTAQGAWSAALL